MLPVKFSWLMEVSQQNEGTCLCRRGKISFREVADPVVNSGEQLIKLIIMVYVVLICMYLGHDRHELLT